MTQVTAKGWARFNLAIVLWGAFVGAALPQSPSATPSAATPTERTPHVPGPAEELYLKLQNVGLDPARTYRIRDASIDRPALHVLFEDGEIGFTEDVTGHITGAFFEGDGELLLTPPDQVERASMTLFTGMAILEERFTSAYLRFNDDTFAELQPYFRPAQEGAAFHSRWNNVVRNLAEQDALRLLGTFSRGLPAAHPPGSSQKPPLPDSSDRMLHVRVQGIKLGSFDVYFDTLGVEQVWAGRARTVDNLTFYDLWTSFTPRSPKAPESKKPGKSKNEDVAISAYNIRAQVDPPTTLTATTEVHAEVRRSGDRVLYFELSRFLQVKEVLVDGQPVEFINNPAVDGTQLARRGNDLVAVVFPDPLQPGRKLNVRFSYSGDVLSEAGGGLLYVGARGTWYPNRGLAMANFDLQFRYPGGWTLVATGKKVSSNSDAAASPDLQTAHWVSERPMVLAGFNLGRYDRATARAGNVIVEAYAARAMEKAFPRPPAIITGQMPTNPGSDPIVGTPMPPSPSRNAQKVADYGARSIDFFSERFGPYPYGSLELTQMPGRTSQGWPGLVFLSSFAFLTPEQAEELSPGSLDSSLNSLILPHEIAHQWWGDLVGWQTYRDQWIVEALANYCALMMMETSHPEDARKILQKYRDDLLVRNKDGESLRDAGPVTLGLRLSSSHFPNGYEAISYGRGTWLFHMLRHMLRNDEELQANRPGQAPSTEEPFVRGLRKLRDRYAGKAITTRELMSVFEEDLPKSLWYEGHRSLDWFVQSWIEGVSLPHLSLQNLKFAKRAQGTEATGTILQTEAPADLVTPVPVYAVTDRGPRFLGTVLVDGPQALFHFVVPADTRKVVLDPHQTLMTSSK